MPQDFEYTLEILRPGADFILYRGKSATAASVLALTPTRRHGADRLAGRLRHEMAMAGNLERAWAALPIALTQYQGNEMLLIEDFGADPLDLILSRSMVPLELCWLLEVARNWSAAIGQMHKSGLVHKDVKPANVLLDSNLRAYLTGFGISSRTRGERHVVGTPDVITGTLAYMAPEQTGRMNRSVDSRSDLYSLGVSLYQLFTRALPFNASDSNEWMHCHIAREPLPPSVKVPELPPIIDGIILKLLAKNPEDRYQTAVGLEADLSRCLDELKSGGIVGGFRVGLKDIADKLVIPEKLYGRFAELEELFASARRSIHDGTNEILFVSGYSGIGKSTFVNELNKLLLQSRGFFAHGKYDQYKRDIPYWTLGQAFKGVVRQLLNRTDSELADWRSDLFTALGANGQLMTDLIPELSLILGRQPVPLQVDAHSAKLRFQNVFTNLVGVFAKSDHPLILFIDDLQWIDVGTLELLETLATQPDLHHLMIVGAYRDNEVAQKHPLLPAIYAIRQKRQITEITLKPLASIDLALLCADALNADMDDVYPLADLILEKTDGNPYFTIQFIRALADEGLLTFDEMSATWQWETSLVKARRITDNVAEFMSAKLDRLPVGTQMALRHLACVGNFSDLRATATLWAASAEEIDAALREAEDGGFIIRSNESATFLHDRVQEAAYFQIPQTERAEFHLRIGHTLLSATTPACFDDKIYELVSQFEKGRAAIRSPEEKTLVAELNLKAGKRAKGSSAYAAALSYLTAGRSILGWDSWQKQYRLTFDIEIQLAECEIVGGELASAESRLKSLLELASVVADRKDVVCLTVLLYFSTGRSEQAVEAALAFLRELKIEWSNRPDDEEVQFEHSKMRRLLDRQPLGMVADLPPMTDPVYQAAMAVLTELFPAAYAVDKNLLELVLLRMTNLSLEFGNCESSSVAYSALNMALGVRFADYSVAFDLGEIACRLVERRGADRYKARVYSCFAAFTMPWIKHLPLCQPLMVDAFEIGSSMGDKAFAAYNSRNQISHLLISGVPLAQVQQAAEVALDYARPIQLGMPTEYFFAQLSFVKRMRGIAIEPRPDEERWAAQNVEGKPALAMMLCYYWVFRLQGHFFLGDFSGALHAAKVVEKNLWAMRSSIEESEYTFFAALAEAASANDASVTVREKAIEAVERYHERISFWARNCEENFGDRQALVGAELARLEGREIDAEHLYEQAIAKAREHGFVQNEALANELAGVFYAKRGLGTSSLAYLSNARECFQRWGAISKIEQLDFRYPKLRPHDATRHWSDTIDTPLSQFDVEVVDKASQTLSSEMLLPSLLEKLMRLGVEHAGAERGLLILLHDSGPRVEAKASTGPGCVEVIVKSSPVSALDLPKSALQYVLRTRERLVLGDASADGLDAHDEYVKRNRPRSILCLPIFREARIIGVLYLENNLATRAFTSDRVAVLDFLASQAAIWLENARLYSDLKRSEAWLTEAQRLSSTGSWYWRLSNDTFEFSEQMYRIYELDPSVPVSLDAIASRVHPDDIPLMEEMVELARGPAADLDYLYRGRMPGGTIKHLHLVAHGTRDKDGDLIYVGAIQDITARHQAEEALSRARSELAHVSRVTTLGVLTASIAHEVNQPLLAIVTNATTCLMMLAATPPNLEGARRTAERSIEAGHHAADVIKKLRALFGKKGTTSELMDLNDAAREVVALSTIELQRSGVVSHFEFAPALPLIKGDRVQLQQVILNLILNASDSMKDNLGRMNKLSVRTEINEQREVCLSVQDTGVGIDPETSDRLFEAFYTTKRDGMGMGLSVSRSIIESHGGRLWASLNSGPGSTFSFSIPIVAMDPKPISSLSSRRMVPNSDGVGTEVRR